MGDAGGGFLTECQQREQAKRADEHEDGFDSAEPDRPDGQPAVLALQYGVEGQRNANAGGSPDELDDRRRDDRGLVGGQLGHVVRPTQIRPSERITEQRSPGADDEEYPGDDGRFSVSVHSSSISYLRIIL